MKFEAKLRVVEKRVSGSQIRRREVEIVGVEEIEEWK